MQNLVQPRPGLLHVLGKVSAAKHRKFLDLIYPELLHYFLISHIQLNSTFVPSYPPHKEKLTPSHQDIDIAFPASSCSESIR